MVKLEVLVKPFMQGEVVQRLLEIGVHSLSYSTVCSANRPLFHEHQIDDETPRDVEFVDHIKLEVVLDEEHLAAIEEALAEKLSTRMVGGAEVIVLPLKEGLRLNPSADGSGEITEI